MGVALGRGLGRSCWRGPGAPESLQSTGRPSVGPPTPARNECSRSPCPRPPSIREAGRGCGLHARPAVSGPRRSSAAASTFGGARRDDRVHCKVRRPQRTLGEARHSAGNGTGFKCRGPPAGWRAPPELTVCHLSGPFRGTVCPPSQPPPAAPPTPQGGQSAGAAAGSGPVPRQPRRGPVPPLLLEKALLRLSSNRLYVVYVYC